MGNRDWTGIADKMRQSRIWGVVQGGWCHVLAMFVFIFFLFLYSKPQTSNLLISLFLDLFSETCLHLLLVLLGVEKSLFAIVFFSKGVELFDFIPLILTTEDAGIFFTRESGQVLANCVHGSLFEIAVVAS